MQALAGNATAGGKPELVPFILNPLPTTADDETICTIECKIRGRISGLNHQDSQATDS